MRKNQTILFLLIFTSTVAGSINGSYKSKLSFGSSSTVKANATLSGVGSFVVLPNPNVMLSNSSPSATFGGITSTTITFGAQNTLLLTADTTIVSADQAWLFPQSATIDGQGHTLTINKNQAIQVSSTATLTIKNCAVIIAGRDAIGCTSDTAKVVFDGSTIILGYEGLGWKQGSIDIQGQVQVLGYSKPFFADPSGAELVLRANDIGFGGISGFAGSSLYTLDLCGPTDERAGVCIARVDKAGSAYFSDSLTPDTPSWTTISGGAVYKLISIGTDGTVWVVGTNNTIYRYRCHKDANVSLTATSGFPGTPAQISVGNRYYVFARNTSGAVYRCTDPDRGFLDNSLTGAPAAWTLISNVNARSIAAGTDGCFWYINQTGQVFMQDSNGLDTLLHDGAGYNFVKVSAKGSSTRYSIALTCSATNRVVVSYDGCPFKDLGLSNIQEACTDVDGNVLLIFQSSKITEDATFGAPLYYRHSFAELPIFALDKTLTFSASANANLTIKSGATLAMGQDTTLRINADNALAETAYNARRHLVFADASSTLLLNRASLETVCAGLSLTQGNIVINGTCSFKPSSWTNCHTEISSDVKLNIRTGANLQTYGRIDYCASSRIASEISSASGLQSLNFADNQSYYFSNPGWISSENRGWALFGMTGLNGSNLNYIPGWTDRYCICGDKSAIGTGMSGFTASSVWDICRNGRTLMLPLSGDLTTFIAFSNLVDFNTGYSTAQDVAMGQDTTHIYYHPGNNAVILNPRSTSTNIGLPSTVQVACGNASYIAAMKNDATVWQYSGSGTTWNSVGMSGYSVRAISIGTDGTIWFIDDRGNLKVRSSGGTVTPIKGARGLDLVKLHFSGSASSYRGIMLSRSGLVYSIDNSRPIEYEKILKAKYCTTSSTGLATVCYPYDNWQGDTAEGGSKYVGYIRGWAGSSWPYPRGAINRSFFDNEQNFVTSGTLATFFSKVEAKGFALYGSTGSGSITGWTDRVAQFQTKISLVSGLTSGAASRLYKVNRGGSGGDRLIFEASLNSSDQSLSTTVTALGIPTGGRDVSVGIDGTVCAINFNDATYSDNVYKWNGGTSWTSLGFGGLSGAVQVSVGNASNIWAIKSDGKVYKWASGTSWTLTSVYPSKGARYLAAGSDGSLWFIDPYGNLKFRSTTGTITSYSGGTGLDLIRVSAAGSTNSYKLVAIDRFGKLYSADSSTQNLELEGTDGYGYIADASVAANGMCAITFAVQNGDSSQLAYGGRSYIGWIKNSAPKSWPYKIKG